MIWVAFDEDAGLPEHLDDASWHRLKAVFAQADSPWSAALELLGLRWPGGDVVRRTQEGAPQINASALTEMISAGCIEAVEAAQGVAYRSRTRLTRLPGLLKSQWRIDAYLAATLAREAPSEPGARLRESLALGLAMQALLLRLPAHDAARLAGWLAGSTAVPRGAAATLRSLQALQLRRTELSDAWAGIASTQAQTMRAAGPELTSNGPWQGLPVYPGRVSGCAWLVDLARPGAPPAAPYIAVFAQARPESVEHYAGAAALVFCQGGVLSHACVVAREQRIPTVTGVGRALITALRSTPEAWLCIDGSTGEVSLKT